MDRVKAWLGMRRPRSTSVVSQDNIPKHVAIIMDGNGRWARKRGLPRIAGHHSGMNNVKKITIAADELGIEILTLYAFSTENWKRPQEEVDFLMNLPKEFFPLEINELVEKNVRIRLTGSRNDLPDYTLRPVDEAIERTKNNTGLILNFALNYGGRNEITICMKQMIDDVQKELLHPDQITEQCVEQYLQTSGLPDPDLLIRTSGEQRISNFMLWQLAYTELWFTEVYWPAFTKEHLLEAIIEYQRRGRRYGGI